jgi:hypothetical protein
MRDIPSHKAALGFGNLFELLLFKKIRPLQLDKCLVLEITIPLIID